MSVRFIIIVYLLLSSPFRAFGENETPLAPIVERIEGENVSLGGVRYPNPGKQPALLVHGLVENDYSWKDFALTLQKMGLDVWVMNLRGHGKGSHRSYVHQYKKGIYGFDYMVTEDAPLMVDYIVKMTGKKVAWVGFSMGAMTGHAYASGVDKNSLSTHQSDDALARKIADEKLSALVEIDGPTSFDHLGIFLRGVANLVHPLAKGPFRAVLPHLGPDQAITDPAATGAANWVGEKVLLTLRPGITGVIPLGVMKSRNLTPEEHDGLARLGISELHPDLLVDFTRWPKTGEFKSAGGFDYGVARKIYVPALTLGASLDRLADARAIEATAKRLGAQYILIQDFSHIDSVTGKKAARVVAVPVGEFLLDSTKIMPKTIADTQETEGSCLRAKLYSILVFGR